MHHWNESTIFALYKLKNNWNYAGSYIIVKKEYNALLEKANAVVGENYELVSKYESIGLRACEQTLYSYYNPSGLCPKCKKAMLVTGLVCPCCGFDGSDYDE